MTTLPEAGTPPPAVKGRDFYQAAMPAGWRLEDEAELPTGRHVSGTKARVYRLLEATAARSHRWPIGRHLGPPGWVPTWVLREPWAGGAAGDRRVRDLREAGVNIEGKPFQAEDEGTASWIWRLSEGSIPGSNRRNPREKSDAAKEPVSAAPLSGFSFSIGFETPAFPDSPLADLRGGADPLLSPPDDDPERYRTHLLETWREGRLMPALVGEAELAIVFAAGQEALAEVLARALEALGAQHRRVG